MYAFWVKPKCSLWSLVKIGQCMPSHKQISVLRRAVASPQSLRICDGHTLQILEKLITTFNPPWLKSNLTKFETVSITFVGGVRSYARCWNKVTFPTTSRWRYRWVSVCAYVRSQDRVTGKPMKFGADRRMYAQVLSEFVCCELDVHLVDVLHESLHFLSFDLDPGVVLQPFPDSLHCYWNWYAGKKWGHIEGQWFHVETVSDVGSSSQSLEFCMWCGEFPTRALRWRQGVWHCCRWLSWCCW